MPPSSCTWKVKLAYGVPFSFASGKNFSKPALMSVTETNCPAMTSTPFSFNLPSVARVVIFTARKLLGGVLFGSVKPNCAVVNVCATSSLVVTVLFVPAGALFPQTVVVAVAVLLPGVLSFGEDTVAVLVIDPAVAGAVTTIVMFGAAPGAKLPPV